MHRNRILTIEMVKTGNNPVVEFVRKQSEHTYTPTHNSMIRLVRAVIRSNANGHIWPTLHGWRKELGR